MKVNLFMLVIALIIGGLILYGFHALEATWLFSIIGAIICTLLLIASISIHLPEHPRSSLMFRTLSGILFFVLLVADIIFIEMKISEALFILTNGIVVASGAIGLHFIYKSEQ